MTEKNNLREHILRNIEPAIAMLSCHFDWKLPSGIKSGELDMTGLRNLNAQLEEKMIIATSCFSFFVIVKKGYTGIKLWKTF